MRLSAVAYGGWRFWKQAPPADLESRCAPRRAPWVPSALSTRLPRAPFWGRCVCREQRRRQTASPPPAPRPSPTSAPQRPAVAGRAALPFRLSVCAGWAGDLGGARGVPRGWRAVLLHIRSSVLFACVVLPCPQSLSCPSSRSSPPSRHLSLPLHSLIHPAGPAMLLHPTCLCLTACTEQTHVPEPPPQQAYTCPCPIPLPLPCQAYYGEYLALYYASDDAVQADPELQAWWEEAKVGGWGGRSVGGWGTGPVWACAAWREQAQGPTGGRDLPGGDAGGRPCAAPEAPSTGGLPRGAWR